MFSEWRRVARNQAQGKLFRREWAEKRLKFQVVRGLQHAVAIANYHRYVAHYLGEQRRLSTSHKTFKALSEASKRQKLIKSLLIYNNLKLAQACITELRAYTQAKNKQRLDLVKIKSELKKRPELARPLKVLRNLGLSRVF